MSKLIKTDAEWRLQLSDLAYKVTRKHGTEPPFSNDNFPKSAGIFICKCCEENLFPNLIVARVGHPFMNLLQQKK